MQIINVNTKNNIFLAPMAGVTSQAFREICLKMGAGLVYAEMVSDKGLHYQNNKTLEMIEVTEKEHPIAMQIFGSDVDTLVEAAKLIESKTTADIIDINMGCPVNKVIKSGAGSALLKDPSKIYDIVKSVVDNVSLPVTVKIRTGYDHNSINCDQVAKLAEKAGASAIAIHGRTRSQMYTGLANLDHIKLVKESVSIPVIGNGDIKDIASAKHMFDYTSVDAIMVGRGACGNPFIFRELSQFFEKGEIIDKPTKIEVTNMMLEHCYKLLMQKGSKTALVEMRTHAAWYLGLLTKTKKYKNDICKISTYNDLVAIVCKVLLDDEVNAK